MQVKTSKIAVKPKALPPAKGTDKISKTQHIKQQNPVKKVAKTGGIAKPAALELNSSQHAYEDLESKIALSQQLIEKYQRDLQNSKLLLQSQNECHADKSTPIEQCNDEEDRLSTTMVHQAPGPEQMQEVQKLNSRLDDLEQKVDMILELFERQTELQTKTTTRIDEELMKLRRYAVKSNQKQSRITRDLQSAMQEFADYSMDIFKSVDEKFGELDATTSEEAIAELVNKAVKKQGRQSRAANDTEFFIITNQQSKQIVELRDKIEQLKASQFVNQAVDALRSVQDELKEMQKQAHEWQGKILTQGTQSETLQDQLIAVQKNFQEFVDKYNADILLVGQKLHDLEK